MKTLSIVMDPIESINYEKDTSLALLWAARNADYQLYYLQQQDMFIDEGIVKANITPLKVFNNADHWFEKGSTLTKPLSEIDIILMRKDPPFDMEYIYSTYLLEMAQMQGAKVINNPESIRDCNEKLFATQFPQCCPPTLVSRDNKLLTAFHHNRGDTILKPLDGMGGNSIFRVKQGDNNLNVILETLTNFGQRQIMAQCFIPDIVNGDKRILMINGTPLDYCLARIPSQGENRGNLAAGGKGIVKPLSERDRWIANEIGPTLKRKGLFFVGLDVIGDYLTEINVTSPTCLREIQNETGIDIGSLLIQSIENQAAL